MYSANKPNKGGRHQHETEPDRIYKLKECCDLLLACGYFRARMPSLNPFDRVVGGMVWSITASNVGVDVDLLFEENSTIGQRIKLSENIVKALRFMKCPNPLQSFQIQGLDYESILPVLKWLVTKVIETRQLTGDQVRAVSINQFQKHYTMPDDEVNPEALAFVGDMASRYKAQRKFKKKASAVFETDEGRVEATLLEYDERVNSVFADEEQVDTRREKGGKVDEDEQEAQTKAAQAEEQRRFAELQTQLDSGAGSVIDKISGSAVGMMVSMRADDILAAQQIQKSIDEDNTFTSVKDMKKIEEERHDRQVKNLQRRIEEAERLSLKRDEPLAFAQNKFNETKTISDEKQDKLKKMEEMLSELEELEQAEGNKDLLDKLKKLVMLNEALKKKETQFKLNCKEQLQKIKDQIAALDEAAAEDDATQVAELERIYKADSDKLQKVREVLAKRNMDIARVNRLIDEIPTRAELLQFERRFTELYEMIADKMVETRTYYDMYNTLNSSYTYLQDELTILESIISNFSIGMKTKAGQEAMVKQFGALLEGVEMSKIEVQSNRNDVSVEEEMLQNKYSKLMDQQRAYFKAVKLFQEECTINEKLSNVLESLQS